MYDNYNLFKFSADLQELLYENEKLKMENEELKKQLKMFEGKLKDDLVLQQKASANWLKYCLKKADDEQI